MESMRFQPPVVLRGRWVHLVPLERSHATALAMAGRDPEIWRFLPYGPCTTTESMERLIDTLLTRQAAGTDLAFTMESIDPPRVVGMTRFLTVDRPNASVEVGGTWLDRALWRTPLNTESKRLMLGYAFEQEGAHRVQLRTDLRNERSQRAIARLGATREGVIRGHLRMPDGYVRSSVVYSILEDEWPGVRRRLDQLLARTWRTP